MRKGLCCLYFISLIIFSACAPSVVPKELKKSINTKITISDVVKNFDKYKEKMVLWGGKILRVVNKKEGTMIEVLQLPLDRNKRPKDVDISGGRFLVIHSGFLDGAIYRPGRDITVVGRICDIRKLPIGEIEYKYPVIKPKKIHLWKINPEEIKVYHEYPSYPCGYPYWWCPCCPYCW